MLLKDAAVLGAGALIGALYGFPLHGLMLALIVLLGWHLFNLNRLERWLERPKIVTAPGGDGPWARIFARIQHLKDRSRLERKKFRRLVKEVRASTKAFPDGGVVLNDRYEIINHNKAARALLGLRKKTDRGMRIDNLIRHPSFVAYLANDGRSSKDSVEIPSPGDPDVWLSCRLIPFGPEQNLLLARDITQTIKTEAMRRDFVANASHELRSPLTVIAGYLDALEDDEECPGSWRQPIADMREQADRMSQLVQDLLELSRLESGASSPMDHAVDIPAILASARKEVLAQGERAQQIAVEVDSEENLLGEETEIQSVVSNLVSNAVRYTPSEGSIVIRWDVDDDGGHLSVEDTGIGIAEVDIPRVTERFFRADEGRARQQGGTGLGLAIVKHALKRHDAELEIRSRPGEGSAFICHFSPRRLTSARHRTD
ncbi:MAG: phosphate regulon sensor histidine kinase PhoR [Gammaproteobacteria bacterium]